TINQNRVWTGEFYNRKKDGTFYWDSSAISAVFDESNQVTNYIAIQRDISEKIAFDESLAIRRKELEDEVTKFLKEIPITLYSIVIDKNSYWEQYPSQNPYDIAYIFLLERFQKFLKEQNGLGICIIDPREGQVEKTFIGKELDSIHNKMRFEDGDFWNKCPNIIERLLFSTSDKTVGIQIADLYCYPIFHMFEYNKEKGEYWRFDEISLPKLYTKDKKLDGFGLKFFPDKTKKDLHLSF
ncbi:MAG: DUF3800 domain-containing protein, partial [Candidatus Moranbacteria bacterium]|nr:DUF3800 domain-containing protein [Candidatus Moranbacteria bacterium]